MERRALVRLPWNPFVCGILDVFTDERNLYMLLEFGALGTLKNVMDKKFHGRMPLSAARFYFSNLFLAIEFIHSHGIIHHDIKPDNLIIGEDGYLMLADFGLATNDKNVAQWDVLGTRDWLSPEAAEARVEHRTRFLPDWWAATIVLYEMVTAGMVRLRSVHSKIGAI